MFAIVLSEDPLVLELGSLVVVLQSLKRISTNDRCTNGRAHLRADRGVDRGAESNVRYINNGEHHVDMGPSNYGRGFRSCSNYICVFPDPLRPEDSKGEKNRKKTRDRQEQK